MIRCHLVDSDRLFPQRLAERTIDRVDNLWGVG